MSSIPSTNSTSFGKHGKSHQVRLHKFRKAVIGNSLRKLLPHVFLYVIDVKVLKSSKTDKFKKYHNGDDFQITHLWFLFWKVSQLKKVE